MRRLTPALVFTLATLAMGEARADTMPQLDFANPLLRAQVVWGAIIFAGFYVLLARWGLPQVAAVLELRAKTIGDDLEQARSAKEQADLAVRELTAARAHAYAESQAAIAQATKLAKARAEAAAAEQAARLDAQLAESETRIAASRDAAMARLGEVASETAQAIVGRLTGQTPDAGRTRQAVDGLMTRHAA